MKPIAGFLFGVLTGLSIAQSAPSLPPGPFQLNVEAVITTNNLTSKETRRYVAFYEDYSDNTNQRSLSISINSSLETRYYYDAKTKQGFRVTRDLQKTPVSQATCVTVNSTDPESTIRGNVFAPINITSFLAWTNDSKPTFIGNDTIRGLSATKWLVPVNEERGERKFQMNITYYFSSNQPMPYYGALPVILRIVLDGYNSSNGGYTFNHVYDITNFAPLGPRDESFFSTPKGVFCPNRIAPEGVSMQITPSFSFKEELVDSVNKVISQFHSYFSQELNITRMDVAFDNDPIWQNKTARVTHDFTNQLQLVSLKSEEKCTVMSLANVRSPMLKWDLSPYGDGQFQLKMPSDFNLMKNLSYQGKRREHGVPVHVWSHMTTYPNNTVEVFELWTTLADWRVRSTLGTTKDFYIWTGIYIYRYDKKTAQVLTEMQSNMYDQLFGTLPAETFTIDDECLTINVLDKDELSIRLTDFDNAYATGRVTYDAVVHAMKALVVSLARVSPLRITDVQIYQEAGRMLLVTFILHGKLQVTGSGDLTAEIENAEALVVLEAGLTDPKTHFLNVAAVDGNTVQMVITGLVEKQVPTEISNTGSNTGSKPISYSSGAMGGLGIGMFFLGVLLCLVFLGILWVKRSELNIPYLRQ